MVVLTLHSTLEVSKQGYRVLTTTPRLAGTPMYCVTRRLVNSLITSGMVVMASNLIPSIGDYCFLFEQPLSFKDERYWRTVLRYVTNGYTLEDAKKLVELEIIPSDIC